MALPEGTKLALAWIGGSRFANRICERSRVAEEKKEEEPTKKEGDDGKDR